ncbi:hypothetical protein FKP32DRAFT_376034 [Trametes sanguinea]|nr:hypothetical protein FKP32DRAFT_376034 [Trametes sanguinea]
MKASVAARLAGPGTRHHSAINDYHRLRPLNRTPPICQPRSSLSMRSPETSATAALSQQVTATMSGSLLISESLGHTCMTGSGPLRCGIYLCARQLFLQSTACIKASEAIFVGLLLKTPSVRASSPRDSIPKHLYKVRDIFLQSIEPASALFSRYFHLCTICGTYTLRLAATAPIHHPLVQRTGHNA